MLQDLLGYTAPDVPGARWIPAVFGTAVFVYGGSPFLKGGWQELRDRTPGMMLLIALAIGVAFASSLASQADLLDLDFWWELVLLIDVMLLGSLAGDEGDRAGVERPRRAGGAPARRGRTRRGRGHRRGGHRRPPPG